MHAITGTGARPGPPLRGALAGMGIAAACLLAAGAALDPEVEVGGLFAVKLLTVQLSTGIALLVFLSARWPLARLGPANHVTLARTALAALLAALVGEGDAPAIAWLATGAALLAIALDGVDGWLARRTRCVSAFGARFDMEADALLILAMAVLAWHLGKAGPWVLLSGLMRYLFVAAALAWPWLRAPLPPSARRRLVCVLQSLALAACLAPVVEARWSHALAALGLAALAASFAADLLWLARRARHDTKENQT